MNNSITIKNYSNWHSIKSVIEEFGTEKLFHEREIWWCSLGLNIGFEEDGKNTGFERPILVFRKFNKGMYWGIPMTSRKKENRFYFEIAFHSKNSTKLSINSFLILSQMRLFSSKRLIRRISRINSKLFENIEKRIIAIISEKENGSHKGSSGA